MKSKWYLHCLGECLDLSLVLFNFSFHVVHVFDCHGFEIKSLRENRPTQQSRHN